MGTPLVLKTMRCRSTRLGLWVLHILGPSRKVKVILTTMIISVRVRIISSRKSLGSIHLFSYNIRWINRRTLKRSMHWTSIKHTACIEEELAILFMHSN